MVRKRSSRIARIFWLVLAISAPVVIAGVVVLWAGATQVIAPARKAVDSHQEQALAEPSLKIQSASALDGKVPYLAVSPVPGKISERGAVLRSQVGESQPQELDACLVLLHGRSGSKEGLLRVAERFCAVGFHCLIPDLPAHGESPVKTVAYGSSDWEKTLPREVVAHARETFGWPSAESPLGLWGLSMGGAFATAAASHHANDWDALMIVSSFDELNGVVSDKLNKLAGPLTPLAQGALNSLIGYRSGLQLDSIRPFEWAAQTPLPVFVAHGDADKLIDHARGKRLFGCFPTADKEWLTVARADHNNVFLTEQPVYLAMSRWFLQRLGPGR